MRDWTGAGCWPGHARGRAVWVEGSAARAPQRDEPAVELAETPQRLATAEGTPQPLPPAERAAELLRFRTELSRALALLEGWSDRQQTLEGRMLLHSYKEALLSSAWSGRAMALVDTGGLMAAEAARRAAAALRPAMERSDELKEQAGRLREVAQWVARRLSPGRPPLPADAILVARTLPLLDLLDRSHPAVIAAQPPAVTGEQPLVWGVTAVGPGWNGRRLSITGRRIRIERWSRSSRSS